MECIESDGFYIQRLSQVKHPAQYCFVLFRVFRGFRGYFFS